MIRRKICSEMWQARPLYSEHSILLFYFRSEWMFSLLGTHFQATISLPKQNTIIFIW